jgi:hypothetical protein
MTSPTLLGSPPFFCASIILLLFSVKVHDLESVCAVCVIVKPSMVVASKIAILFLLNTMLFSPIDISCYIIQKMPFNSQVGFYSKIKGPN